MQAIWDEDDEFKAQANFKTLDGASIDAIITYRIPKTIEGFRSIPVSIVDITEKVQIENQLFQAQKVAAIGQLASGIAHDINNMLMPVLGLSEVIQKDLEPGSRQAKRFEKVIEAAERARDVLQPLVSFAREAEPNRKQVNVKDMMERILDVVRPALPSTLRLEYNFSNISADAMIDESAMTSVMMNLATNARDAMIDGKGKMSISLSDVDGSEVCNPIFDLKASEPYAKLTVQDQGVGMSKTTVDHIFDPFYTTKEVGAGAH
ncbi:ATP-binding protein [Magnetovibrio sp. PR-2]|uniref:two-component system sensor histidine kinase NtrB n=1 Tax=Magnetovibrio sp. PR-2 TaxID=3120356 RepID=UPI002FCE224B